MKTSPISFKGVFCLEQRDLKREQIQKLHSKVTEYSIRTEVSSYTDPGKLFVRLPDEYDEKLKKFFSKNSIKYVHIDEEAVLSPKNIVSRMILNETGEKDPEGLFLANVKKLDMELQKNPLGYVGRNAQNGSWIKYENFKKFLVTNQKIKSPIVYIDRVSKDDVKVRIYDGRHRFAVLRDMGLEQIPITMDKESLILARKIGLVE